MGWFLMLRVPERRRANSPLGLAPMCLLETDGGRGGLFVASRGPDGVAHEVPAAGVVVGWLSNEELPVGVLAAVWLERGTCTDDPKQECPRGSQPLATREVLMTVIIGVDPHKATHTAVAIDDARGRARPDQGASDPHAGAQLLAWAEPLGERTWAIESAGRARLSAGPAARRRGRDGARCASHVGVAGAGAGHRPFRQERSQRRAVGRDRRAAGAGVASGRGRRPRRGAAAVGETQHRHRQPTHPGRVPAPQRVDGARTGRNRQGTQRF